MTTRAELRASIRETLSDRSVFPDVMVNQWIDDAIRDYSAYFSRPASVTLTFKDSPDPEVSSEIAADTLIDLSGLSGLQGIVRVRYPVATTPGRYLGRLNSAHLLFSGNPYYDVYGNPPNEIELGETPEDGEQITIAYTASHTLPDADTDTLTVPDAHLEALKEFVKWQAIKRLEMDESVSPDTKNLILSELGLNAVRAERIYSLKISAFARQQASGRATGPWSMDDKDRIY